MEPTAPRGARHQGNVKFLSLNVFIRLVHALVGICARERSPDGGTGLGAVAEAAAGIGLHRVLGVRGRREAADGSWRQGPPASPISLPIGGNITSSNTASADLPS